MNAYGSDVIDNHNADFIKRFVKPKLNQLFDLSKRTVKNENDLLPIEISSELQTINEHLFPVSTASELTKDIHATRKATYSHEFGEIEFNDDFIDASVLRSEIFSRHTSLSVMLANGYKQLHKFIGYKEAVDRLKIADDSLTLFDIKLSSDDSQLCEIAEDKARACRLKVENQGISYKTFLKIQRYVSRYTFQMPDFDKRYFEANTFKRSMLPSVVKDLAMRNLEGCLNRVSDPIWWRRQLRSKQGVVVEQIARDLRLVHKKASPYISNHTIYSR